ncbi:hypothetical protein AX774_g968 [Zancudomyces culisetae]|uniref:Uncharacterized protein n=1 Tax=Zancudomyces culisetae TaxID=1213189 RepID=A0A1R1PX07_ZANCU|nr:hypothetical protein AX774_g968 [Zancudomyces culisetae]|eukprot:OMH85478.1 hypothetical protein AX774_g968 [Zancudomyces culisetae]
MKQETKQKLRSRPKAEGGSEKVSLRADQKEEVEEKIKKLRDEFNKDVNIISVSLQIYSKFVTFNCKMLDVTDYFSLNS